MTRLSLLFIAAAFLALSGGCKKEEKNNSPAVQKEVQNVPPRKNVPPAVKKSMPPPEEAASVKMVGPKDALTCESICDHLGYCQQKSKNHPPSARRKRTCIARCKGEKSETGKAKNKVIRECVDSFRGDQCDKLLKCMSTRLMEVRKKFMSMGQP